MSKEKTVATEIACALGCLGLSLAREHAAGIEGCDEESLDLFAALVAAKNKETLLCHQAGKRLHADLTVKPIKARWMGPQKTTNASAAAKDLYLVINESAGKIPVSVKDASDILWNGSASRFVEGIWDGELGMDGTRGEHWFLKKAPAEYEAFYLSCGGPAQTGHATAAEYNKDCRDKKKRKGFAAHAAQEVKKPAAGAAYKALCKAVSEASAEAVNGKIEKLKAKSKGKRLAEALKNQLWEIFRVNSEPYFLCGTEKKDKRKQAFVVRIPGKDEWARRFEIRDVKATAKSAGQPEMLVAFSIFDAEKDATHSFSVRYEIRWSHGKFNGNPEAKIYKTFRYTELPWTQSVV